MHNLLVGFIFKSGFKMSIFYPNTFPPFPPQIINRTTADYPKNFYGIQSGKLSGKSSESEDKQEIK